MSSDLERLESASALRTWEEQRAKRFVAWREAATALVAGLRAGIKQGAAQQRKLDSFIRHRSLAEKAYAQALAFSTAPPEKKDGNSKEAAQAEPAEALRSPLIDAVAEIQRQTLQAREAFATSVLEKSVLTGLAATATEFESTSSALLQCLDAGLSDVSQVHSRAVEAMTCYHKTSIEAPRKAAAAGVVGGSSSAEPSSDAWLQEHRYRRAVGQLRERQHAFTVQLCSAVEEARRLEEWRDEMARKVLNRFCTKLHQVETTVQSLANEGVRALAAARRSPDEKGVLTELEEVLKQPPALPTGLQAAAETSQSKDWPTLTQLKALSRLGQPPKGVLGRTGGPLQVPRRWYGVQLCIVVLTKDDWLHCFNVANPPAAPKAKPQVSQASSGAGGSEDADIDPSAGFLDLVDADPQWSMLVPGTSITAPVAGRPRCFEIAEVRNGFLGIRTARRELLQADTEDTLRGWLTALVQAGATGPSLGAAAAAAASAATLPSSQPPPPPPPPPPRSAAPGSPEDQPGDAASSHGGVTSPISTNHLGDDKGDNEAFEASSSVAAAGPDPAAETQPRVQPALDSSGPAPSPAEPPREPQATRDEAPHAPRRQLDTARKASKVPITAEDVFGE